MNQKGPACRQAGLAPLLIILVLAGAIALAGGGYYLGRQNSIFPKSDLDYFVKDEESLKNRVGVEDFINSWLTYSSDKYTFKYPPALNAYKTEKNYVRVLFNPGTPDQEAQFSVDFKLVGNYANYEKAVFAARKRFINPQIEAIDGGTKISASFDVGTDKEVHIIVVLLKYKQGAVALEYTGNSKNIPTFNKILSTFKFADQVDETVYTESDRSANWKTYYSSYMGLELKYPADWKIKTDSQYPQQFDLYPPESDPELPSINLSLSLSDIPFNSNPSPSPDMSPFKPIVIAGITGIYSEYMPPKLGELRLPLVGGECQQPYEINLPVKNKTLFIFSCKSLQPRFEKILDNLVLK